MNLQDFGAALGYSFQNLALLTQALTHSSYGYENEVAEAVENAGRDNEKLEFLGDAILSLITAEHLFNHYPGYEEGRLSKVRHHLVSERSLAKVAHQLELGEALRLGRGEDMTGGRTKPGLLADAVEALIAAIYLDGGITAAREFVIDHVLAPELARLGSDPAARLQHSDAKSALQDYMHAQKMGDPVYEVVAEYGPEHEKRFTVALSVGDKHVQGVGRTKKQAEQNAAELALQRMRPIEGESSQLPPGKDRL